MNTENKFEWTDELAEDLILSVWLEAKMNEGGFSIKSSLNKFKKSKQQNTIPVGKKFEDDYIDLGNGRYRHKAQQNTIQKDWEIVSAIWRGNNTEIQSVRRFYDGKEFSVGDETNFGIIEAFYICEEEDSFCYKEMMVCFKEVKGDIDISQLKKVKQPLFKTEDGVSLMEGENCFYIVIHVMGWDIIEAKVSNDIFTSSNVKIFSKKEAARDFVLMNKPVLSINDVMG